MDHTVSKSPGLASTALGATANRAPASLAGCPVEAQRARVPVSLATIYNTLNQFSHVGLLRQIAMDGTKSYFDTNVTDHHHFFIEGEEGLVDIPGHDLSVSNLPEPPEGMEIARVEVVVRLRKSGA